MIDKKNEPDDQQKNTSEIVERTIRDLEHVIVVSCSSMVIAKIDPETLLETTVNFLVKGNTVLVNLQLMTEAADFSELLSIVRALNKRGNITTRYSG